MARMSEKDKDIIAKNEGVSPHDLLTKHGLSENGFNMLVAQNETQRQAAATSKKPTLTPSTAHILQPIEVTQQPIARPSEGKVRLVPKSGGNGTVMSRDMAEKMAKKYPTIYTIR